MRVLIKTLGCKANRADSDRLSEALSSLAPGSEIEIIEVNNASDRVPGSGSGLGPVDFCIINTCTVTHVADRKSRAQIKLFKKTYPDAQVIVMGCGPKIDRVAFEKIGVDAICSDGDEVLDVIGLGLSGGESRVPGGESRVPGGESRVGRRTRAVLKIQDGCNNFCTYCVIPFVRGRERSEPACEVLRDIETMVGDGCKEIVLTGINIGNWKDGDLDLGGLIALILDRTSLPRLRLSSIEPQNFGESFEKLLSDPAHSVHSGRFCPHLHMSLQSGSDRILKLMKRRYDAELYKKVAQKMRVLSPDIALTTDVIVGFPGETLADFKETCDFVREIGFAKIHVFPYSRRAGTKAALMDGQVPEQEKKRRARELQKIADELREQFLVGQIGKVWPVLIEQRVARNSENGKIVWEGFTPNYIKVRVRSDKNLVNQIVDVRLGPGSLKTKAAYVEATLV